MDSHFSDSYGKRISVIIKNKNGKYVVLKERVEDIAIMRFPGFFFDEELLPDNESTDNRIKGWLKNKMGIQAADIKRIENYYSSDYSYNHYIYKVGIYTGELKKMPSCEYQLQALEDFEFLDFDVFGKQVITKIEECTYCQKICSKKSEIDAFLQDYFQHNVGYKIFSVLDNNITENIEEMYQLFINTYFGHLRALLVETPNLKKNRTVQNMLGLYERKDLLSEIESLLSLNALDDLTFKDIIKIFVDKNVAHYDSPDENTRRVLDYCYTTFSKNGTLPLEKLISYVDSYIISILFEVFYYAGEMGEMISETTFDFAYSMDCNRQLLLEIISNGFSN